MKIPSEMPRLKRYRFPCEVVAYAVLAYHRFALSAADVEDLLAVECPHWSSLIALVKFLD
jgi:putative transposase